MAVIRTEFLSNLKSVFDNRDSQLNIHNFALDTTNPYVNNLVSIYKDELLADCRLIAFDDEEKVRFNKDPKKLSHAIYGTTDLFFLIMIFNDYEEYTDMDLLNSDNPVMIPTDAKKSFIVSLLLKLNKDLRQKIDTSGEWFV